MASHATKVVSLVIFCMIVLGFLSCSPSASRTYPSDSNHDNNKIKLGVYYESLCPYSANFIVNHLVKVFEDDELFSIVDLHLSPWGNAKLRRNATFVCQHGPFECLLNTVEACAIDVWPDLIEHFKFIYCVETLVYEHEYLQWETCFDTLELDPKPMTDCYTSGNGTELELKYAADTNSLVPPHKYVPWVIVDGQPLYEDYENFISYICKAYKGASVPDACSSMSHTTTHGDKPEPVHPLPVCPNEMTKLSTANIRSKILSWIRKMNTVASR